MSPHLVDKALHEHSLQLQDLHHPNKDSLLLEALIDLELLAEFLRLPVLPVEVDQLLDSPLSEEPPVVSPTLVASKLQLAQTTKYNFIVRIIFTCVNIINTI